MLSPSNLYAEKVFSEHPVALWALDEKVDYLSLITEDQRDIESEWSVTNGTAYLGVGITNAPFPDSVTSVVDADVPLPSFTTELKCVSPDLIDFTLLNQDMGTFSFGLYFLSDSAFLQTLSIGYEYTDPDTLLIVENVQTFNISTSQSWRFISATFEIPNKAANLRLVIKGVFDSGGGVNDYKIFFNGISLGQWSEEFNTSSLGVEPVTLPDTIPFFGPGARGVIADAYGLADDYGYYLVRDNYLVAKNTSIPLVYGASNVTKILHNPYYEPFSDPSLILPGKGFLNQKGQFSDYTVEFWARIDCNTTVPKKIFGPVTSYEGLFVEGGFITLVIGNKSASYFVGEWYRPMLLQIRLIRNAASLLINGEQVINLEIDTDSLQLAPESVETPGGTFILDWIAFYAHEDVSLEIDCVAIYTYSVPITVAKRRFVYGQAVLSGDGIDASYGGRSAFIDYPFADYTSNYQYPNLAKWEQGAFDNLNATQTSITTPSYSLPEIFLSYDSFTTLESLYQDNLTFQQPGDPYSFTFDNGSEFFNYGYFNIPKIDFLPSPVAGIYGVFSSDQSLTEDLLIKIYDPITKNYFIIKKDLDEIKYILYFNGIEQELFTTDFIENEEFAVGINIQKLCESFGGNVLSFFGNRSRLGIYIANDDSTALQFSGKIYSIGLCTKYNLSKIQNLFDSDGFALPNEIVSSTSKTYAEQLIDHTASYTLLPTVAYSRYFLDIGVNGYWQDYLPLSYFGQFVKDSSGNTIYDLDFLQFNIGYPAISKFVGDKYDTESLSVRSYITFQYVTAGANTPLDSFINYEPADKYRIIDLSEYPNWLTTKFEVVDNTLIYPTANQINFNDLAIVYYLEFNTRRSLSQPTIIKNLEFSSQALDNSQFNEVGTRFGVGIYPYARSGVYYDYKAKNPFSIYKGSTPYLYLTKSSGIELRGEYSLEQDRGLGIPVNQTIASNFKMTAMQVWMRYAEQSFPDTDIHLFEIVYNDDTIIFVGTPTNLERTRLAVTAKSLATGQTINGISFYLNGNLVRQPVITASEWASLGISFTPSLSFDLFRGSVNFTGPFVFNNIGIYQANSLQEIQGATTRPWADVLTDGVIDFEWQYWITNNFIWNDVLVLESFNLYGTNPLDIYKTYLGTNKFIIDDNEGVIVDYDRVVAYSDVIKEQKIIRPV